MRLRACVGLPSPRSVRRIVGAASTVLITLGCSGDSTPPPEPVPLALTIQSIAPADAQVMSQPVTITVTGTGFGTGSTVRWNGVDKTTTRVSATNLTAVLLTTDLATAGEYTVTVRTAQGATVTAPQTFSVRNPQPVIDSLRSASVAVNGDGDVMVRGRGFVSSSVVRANGSDRLTIFGDSTALRVILSEADLASAGQIALTVVNGGPGGGTSSARVLSVLNPLPQPSGLLPATVAAGGSGFTLRVTGLSLAPSAVVTWNGSDRVTTFDSTGALNASILASDITANGVAEIRVRNGAPGGGTSLPLLFTIGTPVRADSAIAVATIPLATSFLVSDVARGIVYAATTDSIVAFVGSTGAVSHVVRIVGQPRRLAIADDGSYLYVNYTTLPSVHRINLTTRAVDLSFDVGKNRFDEQLVAEDMAVVPGAPRSLVVARVSGTSPGYAGVSVYDDGVLRGAIAVPSPLSPNGSSRLAATKDPLVFFGFGNRTTERGLREYRAGPGGMTVSEIWGGLVGYALATGKVSANKAPRRVCC